MFQGEVWVRCDSCSGAQLEMLPRPTPSDCEVGEEFSDEHWEPRGMERVGPPEGGDANGSDDKNYIQEPPPGFLSTLWEGGPLDG